MFTIGTYAVAVLVGFGLGRTKHAGNLIAGVKNAVAKVVAVFHKKA